MSLSISRKVVMKHAEFNDLSRRNVADTFFNSQMMFDRVIETANHSGVALGILIIPSKELVFYTWGLKEGAQMPENFITAAERQVVISRTYRKFFEDRGVEVVDATEYVVAALDRSLAAGKPLYGGGHPLATGYEAYARGAMEIVR